MLQGVCKAVAGGVRRGKISPDFPARNRPDLKDFWRGFAKTFVAPQFTSMLTEEEWHGPGIGREFRIAMRTAKAKFRKVWGESLASGEEVPMAGLLSEHAQMRQESIDRLEAARVSTLIEQEQARITAVIKRLGAENLGDLTWEGSDPYRRYPTRSHLGFVYNSKSRHLGVPPWKRSVANFPEDDVVLAVNIADVATDAEVVNGITVLTAGDGENYHHLGAWMDHGAIFAQSGFAPGQRPENLPKKYDGLASIYYFHKSDSRTSPAEDATYRGVFFGIDMHPDRFAEAVRGTVEMTYRIGGREYICHIVCPGGPGSIRTYGVAEADFRVVVDNHPKVKTAEISGYLVGSLSTDNHQVQYNGHHDLTNSLTSTRSSTINGAPLSGITITNAGLFASMNFLGPNHEEIMGTLRISGGVATILRHWHDLENGFWIEGVYGAKRQQP